MNSRLVIRDKEASFISAFASAPSPPRAGGRGTRPPGDGGFVIFPSRPCRRRRERDYSSRHARLRPAAASRPGSSSSPPEVFPTWQPGVLSASLRNAGTARVTAPEHGLAPGQAERGLLLASGAGLLRRAARLVPALRGRTHLPAPWNGWRRAVPRAGAPRDGGRWPPAGDQSDRGAGGAGGAGRRRLRARGAGGDGA